MFRLAACVLLAVVGAGAIDDRSTDHEQKHTEMMLGLGGDDEPAKQPRKAPELVTEPFFVKFHVVLTGRTKKGKLKREKDASFVVKVNPKWSPKGATQFKEIIQENLYDEGRFYRVKPGFVVQWGIPADVAKAKEWTGRRIKDDNLIPGVTNKKGTVAFARSGPNSRTTQIFVNYGDNSKIDRMGYTPFGTVVEGLEVLEKVNAEHGEQPDQNNIQREGNEYLAANFPNLSWIKSAEIVEMGEDGSCSGTTEL